MSDQFIDVFCYMLLNPLDELVKVGCVNAIFLGLPSYDEVFDQYVHDIIELSQNLDNLVQQGTVFQTALR